MRFAAGAVLASGGLFVDTCARLPSIGRQLRLEFIHKQLIFVFHAHSSVKKYFLACYFCRDGIIGTHKPKKIEKILFFSIYYLNNSNSMVYYECSEEQEK